MGIFTSILYCDKLKDMNGGSKTNMLLPGISITFKALLYRIARKWSEYKQDAALFYKYRTYNKILSDRRKWKKYYKMPIINNRILFMCFEAGKYACNPKCVSEYLAEKYGGQLEIIWAFTEPEQFSYLEEKGYKLVRYQSKEFYQAALTAKVFLYNMRIPGEIPFRKEQVVISTGHGGGAYKKLLLDTPNILDIDKKTIEFSTKNTTIFVSSCKKYTKCVIRGAYAYDGEVLETGMPRNDDLVNGNYEEGRKVREYFHIPKENKIIIYAPTYRKGTRTANDYGIDAEGIVQAAKERFGGQWTFMYRMHYFIKTELPEVTKDYHVVDATHYSDMQDLIKAADILITDYSSCVWDFSLMDKPCFLYATDIDEYLEKQGFYTDVYDWHFPIGKNNRELMELIRNFNEEEYLKGIHKHHEEMGILESGEATRLIGERIYKECSGS
ncbi:MAG: CDP-glycerol glycerophosphotransferase family protein [Roseburia sp.]|nr:CDP-glycerol glycerophosphotransferase family protein [Roseburia sp.]MCM1278130.1 CDP-glycerol glycerophosphotransferase family protein [Robinsoniella sp.]